MNRKGSDREVSRGALPRHALGESLAAWVFVLKDLIKRVMIAIEESELLYASLAVLVREAPELFESLRENLQHQTRSLRELRESVRDEVIIIELLLSPETKYRDLAPAPDRLDGKLGYEAFVVEPNPKGIDDEVTKFIAALRVLATSSLSDIVTELPIERYSVLRALLIEDLERPYLQPMYVSGKLETERPKTIEGLATLLGANAPRLREVIALAERLWVRRRNRVLVCVAQMHSDNAAEDHADVLHPIHEHMFRRVRKFHSDLSDQLELLRSVFRSAQQRCAVLPPNLPRIPHFHRRERLRVFERLQEELKEIKKRVEAAIGVFFDLDTEEATSGRSRLREVDFSLSHVFQSEVRFLDRDERRSAVVVAPFFFLELPRHFVNLAHELAHAYVRSPDLDPVLDPSGANWRERAHGKGGAWKLPSTPEHGANDPATIVAEELRIAGAHLRKRYDMSGTGRRNEAESGLLGECLADVIGLLTFGHYYIYSLLFTTIGLVRLPPKKGEDSDDVFANTTSCSPFVRIAILLDVLGAIARRGPPREVLNATERDLLPVRSMTRTYFALMQRAADSSQRYTEELVLNLFLDEIAILAPAMTNVADAILSALPATEEPPPLWKVWDRVFRVFWRGVGCFEAATGADARAALEEVLWHRTPEVRALMGLERFEPDRPDIEHDVGDIVTVIEANTIWRERSDEANGRSIRTLWCDVQHWPQRRGTTKWVLGSYDFHRVLRRYRGPERLHRPIIRARAWLPDAANGTGYNSYYRALDYMTEEDWRKGDQPPVPEAGVDPEVFLQVRLGEKHLAEVKRGDPSVVDRLIALWPKEERTMPILRSFGWDHYAIRFRISSLTQLRERLLALEEKFEVADRLLNILIIPPNEGESAPPYPTVESGQDTEAHRVCTRFRTDRGFRLNSIRGAWERIQEADGVAALQNVGGEISLRAGASIDEVELEFSVPEVARLRASLDATFSIYASITRCAAVELQAFDAHTQVFFEDLTPPREDVTPDSENNP